MAQTAFPRDSWTGDMLVKIGHEEQQRSEHAHAAFLEAMKRHKLPIIDENDIEGPSASWLETRSLLNEPLEEARYHDMTIMGREAQLSQENLKSVLMRSGRPLVIAPGKPPAVFGRRIALAWKESPEAARAVTAALPV